MLLQFSMSLSNKMVNHQLSVVLVNFHFPTHVTKQSFHQNPTAHKWNWKLNDKHPKKIVGFWCDELWSGCFYVLIKFPFWYRNTNESKNLEGRMVGDWDGNSWDPSQRFWSLSQQNPTRTCSTKLPQCSTTSSSTQILFSPQSEGLLITQSFHCTHLLSPLKMLQVNDALKLLKTISLKEVTAQPLLEHKV